MQVFENSIKEREAGVKEPSLSLGDVLEAVNVAELLSEQRLNQIGAMCKTAYEEDEASRERWLSSMEEALKLALQFKEEKNFPMDNAANVKLPILTDACLAFHARAFPALINERNLVKYRVFGVDTDTSKSKKGSRISRHMTYQLTEEMVEWVPDMDTALLTLPLTGCIFKKTYYCPNKRRNVSELVMAQDLVVNNGARSFDDALFVSHVFERDSNYILSKIRRGDFLDVSLSSPEPRDVGLEADAIGILSASGTFDSVYCLIESHCYLDLDNDGYKEPYIVLFERSSCKVLRISPRFDEDDVEYNDKGEVVSITPESYFTRYLFMPSPGGGFYGMGFGLLLSPINEAGNTLVNQLLDAGTRSNSNSGFVSKNFRAKGGSITIEPNTWYEVPMTGDDIRKGIYPLTPIEPSPVLLQLLQLLISSGQSTGSIQSINSGENPGQNQPLGTSQMVLQESLKVLNGVYKRIYRSFSEELKKLFELNGKYLESYDYMDIVEAEVDPGSIATRQDYSEDDGMVVPSADPNISSKLEKMSLARDLAEMASQGMPINPSMPVKMYLEAMDVSEESIQEIMTLPDNGPSAKEQLDMAALEHQVQVDWADRQIELLRVQGNYIRDIAASVAKLMEAEAKEPGLQMQQAMNYFNQIQEKERVITERAKVLSDYIIGTSKIEKATKDAQ